MRSFCSRSIITTSHVLQALGACRGRRARRALDLGRQQRLRRDHAHLGHAERGERVDLSERATRECSTSPTIATVAPEKSLL